MSVSLVKPSQAAIRARFIQEKLQKAANGHRAFVRVVASGKTGSGKSTLGNRLIGIDYFLKSDGHQDCTEVVNIIQFLAGLEYVDLPGVASSDQLENYNRAALSMSQVTTWPQTKELTLELYDYQRQQREYKLAIDKIATAPLQPDLIFYLIAPHHKLLHEEQVYIAELLQHYRSDQIIYVLNVFSSKEARGGKVVTITTPQDIEDAQKCIHALHTQARQGNETGPRIVAVNCWTGEGMTELIAQTGAALPGEKGRLFEEIMRYQQQKTPNAYVQEVKNELMGLFARVALEKPDPNAMNSLKSYLQSLADFLGSLRDQKQEAHEVLSQIFNNLIYQISQSCTEQVTEDEYESRSIPYRTTIAVEKEETELDYSRPITKEETEYITESYWSDTRDVGEFLESIFDGNIGEMKRSRTREQKRQVIVGYETKIRRVIHYEDVTRYASSSVKVGTRVVGVRYHPFGFRGVALLATLCNAMVVGNTSAQQPVEQLYAQIAGGLQASLADCHTLSTRGIVQLLKKHTDILFPDSFDKNLKHFCHL